MKTLQFWQQRLIQLVHDPVHKAALLSSGVAHTASAKQLFEFLVGLPLKHVNNAPDRLASGADRPVLGGPQDCRVDWRKAPQMRHPLQAAALHVPDGGRFLGEGAQARAKEAQATLQAWWEGRFAEQKTEEVTSSLPLWADAEGLRTLCLQLWRNQRDWGEALGLPGDLVPADTRCPDHALYSHTRIAAAVSYLTPIEQETPPEREPCMVQISLHGVQDFIAASRKTRDLWTACMVYGELVWAAMEPIVEHYGPETILYPDLLGNPLMDQWMLRKGGAIADAVPQHIREHGAPTAAVPVPNTFVALIPQGGADHLLPIPDLMERVQQRVRARWQALVEVTRTHLEGQSRLGPGSWTRIYDASLARPPDLSWTAVAWPRRMWGQPVPPENLPWLPGRPPDAEVGDLPEVLQKRAAALRPWIPAQSWRLYEQTRTVFWRMPRHKNADYLGGERGFDYPLVHHQLTRVHAITGLSRTPPATHEPGEQCTLTGRHRALCNQDERGLQSERQAVRKLWERLGEDDASGDITERLGGPGAFKRFLAMAGTRAQPGLVERWNGVGQDWPDPKDITAPFPSTAGIAAGPFLERVAKQWPSLRSEATAVLDCLEQASLDTETQHPKSLPRLIPWTTGTDDTLRRFLTMEPQYLNPDVLQVYIERAKQDKNPALEERRKALLEAVKVLLSHDPGPPSRRGERSEVSRVAAQGGRRAIFGAGGGRPALLADRGEVSSPLKSKPGEEYAILAMDGDGLSKLILGDPETIQSTWADVLHPDAVQQVRAWADPAKLAWQGLLAEKRVMGPSLHATITRALADFTDTLAPWVIEVEFHGRLIYAGGDDLLAMLPAQEVIPAAARLQQLYSAPWVVDTQPKTPPWAGRRGQLTPEQLEGAWRRFRVPCVPANGAIDPRTWEFEDTIRAGNKEHTPGVPWDTKALRVFPMLGRHHSLSGGAAFGHFKQPLRGLLQAARENLELRAKVCTKASAKLGRPSGHLAISRYTGNGNKATWTAPWDGGKLADTAATLIKGFESGKIAARLPYGLREQLEALMGILDEPKRRKTCIETLIYAENPAHASTITPCVAQGLETALMLDSSDAARAQSAVAGLLITRHLSAGASHDPQ